MKTVVFELTAGEKERLESDFKEYGGGPLTPVDFNPFATTPAKVDPNEKKEFRCVSVSDNFFVLAPHWLDKVVKGKS